MFGIFKKKPPQEPPKNSPPVPDWKPDIVQPQERIIDRISYYTGGSRDFLIFKNGTAVILESGLSDEQAETYALEVLRKIFHAHPDMKPTNMNDGNILVSYNHPAANVVLKEVTDAHWPEIDKNHQRALATSEVLMTPMGQNVFDEFGKKALFGRCYMFMDAQDPKVSRIVRKAL